MVTCEVSESATFKEMVVWPTVFDMQVLITNHFVLLRGKPIGGERQMKVFCKEGKVSDKEMNGSESLMKHRYQKKTHQNQDVKQILGLQLGKPAYRQLGERCRDDMTLSQAL